MLSSASVARRSPAEVSRPALLTLKLLLANVTLTFWDAGGGLPALDLRLPPSLPRPMPTTVWRTG